MFPAIYRYELRSHLRKLSTYVYPAVFFAIALVAMLGTAGYFDGPAAGKEQEPLINSPYAINFIFQYFNKFFLFLLPAVIGAGLYRDFSYRVHPILYSFPIRKFGYLTGKFLSGLTVVLVITLSVGLALIIGEYLLGTENARIGPFRLTGYRHAYLLFTFPNMLIYGLLVFMIVGAFRNIFAGFISILLLFFLQIITENLFAGSPLLLAIADPFGQNAINYQTRFWTVGEQNVKALPVSGMILYNRLFWLSMVALIGRGFYRRFALGHEVFRWLAWFKKVKISSDQRAVAEKPANTKAHLHFDWSFRAQFRSMLQLAVIELAGILRSKLFWLLVSFGLFALVFALGRVTNRDDFLLLPLTRIMLAVPMFFFSTIMVFATFIYAGMLVHRPRQSGMHHLIDVTPTANWALLGAKLLALIGMQVFLLLLLLLCGMALQVYNGYWQLEAGLYLYHLLLITLPPLIIWAVIALAGHTFLSNLYLGIFSLLLVWVGKDQLPRLGIDSYLLRFNTTPPLIYSDLNGFGHGLSATFRLHAYWLAFSVIVLVVVYLFWRRGVPSVFAARMRKAAGNWRGRPLYLSVGAVVLMLLLGISIFRAERMDVRISGEDGPDLEHFKQQYDSYREAIQPRITTVRLNLHLQPDSCAFRASGSYVLVNKSREDISTLLIRTGYDEITDYTIGWGNTLISRDSGFKFAVHELNPPLPPGDSLLFHFHIHSMPNTLLSRHSGVLENGTFLRTDILPRFGYFADRESYTPSDSLVATRNFYADDADLVHFRTTISTMTGQVAIAPGYLTGSRQEAGRTHFTYRTENPVKMAAAFNSGRYQIREERHENVLLQVYHHAAHGRNVEQMLSGLKAALDYNTHYFAPYQHRSARIIEFPVSEGTYATTMANTIPISEQRFVIRSPEDAGKIDLSFYVPAHELTHQWWGNQLVPAHAAGAKMLTESITEYISLNLYEQQFGKAAARQFLQLQHRRYLTGRTRERKTENPLYLISSEQEYIAYGKGAMAFHALKHYWGEAALNEALSEFLHTYRFRTDRYPTSGDLLDLLKKHMPDELQYLIADYFENITFYDNGVEQVAVHPDGNGAYTVSALLRLRKYRLEPEEKEVPLRDLLEVAAYNDQGALLWVKKIRVNAPQMSFDWLVQERPARIVIDPNYLLPDLNMADNFFDL